MKNLSKNNIGVYLDYNRLVIYILQKNMSKINKEKALRLF